jgi:hypothetical protein
LTKSEICGTYFGCRNLFPARGQAIGETRKPWLFETLAHNLSREPARGSDLLTYIARNPLKRLDSKNKR